MGYEIFLAVPLILMIGFYIAKFCHNVIGRIVIIVLVFLILFFFLFVYPAPLGLDIENKRIYFSGGETSISFAFKNFFKNFFKLFGIEFV